MALNIELLLALLVEQEQALITADRCRSQIPRLLAEQQQRNRLEQATTHAPVEHSAGTPKKRRQQSTQEEDTSDEDLLEALRLHELRASEKPAHSPAMQHPAEITQGMQHTAMQGLPLPDTWSPPPSNAQHIKRLRSQGPNFYTQNPEAVLLSAGYERWLLAQ